jgi:hypothetical protein
MNPKLFFVLVALIVIAALVGLGAGVFGGSGQALDLKFGGLDQLRASVVKEQALAAADIQGASPPACLDLFKKGSLAMKSGDSCVFSVSASDSPSRKVSFSTPAGQNLRLAARMPLNDNQNQLNVRKTLVAPTPADLQFFKEGGTLTLWCETPGLNGACQVKTVK